LTAKYEKSADPSQRDVWVPAKFAVWQKEQEARSGRGRGIPRSGSKQRF
jgi:hypothetical protein